MLFSSQSISARHRLTPSHKVTPLNCLNCPVRFKVFVEVLLEVLLRKSRSPKASHERKRQGDCAPKWKRWNWFLGRRLLKPSSADNATDITKSEEAQLEGAWIGCREKRRGGLTTEPLALRLQIRSRPASSSPLSTTFFGNPLLYPTPTNPQNPAVL